MNFRIIRFLAWRYVTGVSFSSSINTMIKICALSMFVGTFSLALVTAIMRGFEQETYKKLKGITPDLIISAPHNTPLEYVSLSEHLQKQHGAHIQGLAPFTLQPIALHNPEAEDPTIIGFLKVIEPVKEATVHTIQQQLTPQQPLAELLDAQSIIVGKGIAQELILEIGDPVVLVHGTEAHQSLTQQEAHKKEVIVKGIITTGIAETDNHLIICSFDCYQTLVNEAYVTHIGIAATGNQEELKTVLRKDLAELRVTSWKDDYPALVSALKLERYAMIFLLSLITLVASMNLLSLIFMVTAYKKTDCALLLSLGINKNEIMAIFMVFSSIITLASSLAGIACAYIAARLMQAYPCISLPDIYYVTHLPADPYWLEFLIVLIGAFIISTLAARIALRTINDVSITHIFRFE